MMRMTQVAYSILLLAAKDVVARFLIEQSSTDSFPANGRGSVLVDLPLVAVVLDFTDNLEARGK